MNDSHKQWKEREAAIQQTLSHLVTHLVETYGDLLDVFLGPLNDETGLIQALKDDFRTKAERLSDASIKFGRLQGMYEENQGKIR